MRNIGCQDTLAKPKAIYWQRHTVQGVPAEGEILPGINQNQRLSWVVLHRSQLDHDSPKPISKHTEERCIEILGTSSSQVCPWQVLPGSPGGLGGGVPRQARRGGIGGGGRGQPPSPTMVEAVECCLGGSENHGGVWDLQAAFATPTRIVVIYQELRHLPGPSTPSRTFDTYQNLGDLPGTSYMTPLLDLPIRPSPYSPGGPSLASPSRARPPLRFLLSVASFLHKTTRKHTPWTSRDLGGAAPLTGSSRGPHAEVKYKYCISVK